MSDSPEPPDFDDERTEEEFALLAEIAAAHHLAPDDADALALNVMLASLKMRGGLDRRQWLTASMTYASKACVRRRAGSPGS